MQKKAKAVILIIIGMAVLYYAALPLFYESFNYYPLMKEDMPYKGTVRVWSILTNQRITLDTEVPSIPVNQFPVYQGRSSSSALNVSFINSDEYYNESHNNRYTGEICFLVANNGIAESMFNLTGHATDLEPRQIESSQMIRFNDSGKYIIQQVRNRNFVTQKGNLPMFSLGRTRITDVKFIYFNGFDTYPCEYKGKTTYYPAWKITAETSNYGNEILIIKAI
ncbi:hypothetical protein [Methanosarcina sp.]|uniref:hypothetical protein n=1 Tax=Methanosarcina sp. TaxID=2213 RepID=UPI002AB9B1C6|nr:hypothetical protein [Methanosarcina sp.]MDY9927684.1 hypothetical protein [Methanosarcina sp.]